MPKPTGRPKALTQEKQDQLCNFLREGNHIIPACAYTGLGSSTYYKYMALADEPNPPQWAVEFADAVKKARAEAELRNVQQIQKAATEPKHWTASAWFLERSYPKRWGRQARLEVTGPEGGPIRLEDPRTALLSLLDDARRSRGITDD